MLDERVQRDQLVDRAQRLARDRREQRRQQRTRRFSFPKRCQLLVEHWIVAERIGLGLGFQKEVERVDRHHVGNEIDRDLEPVHLLREHDAGEVVALRILHPVDEMRLRLDRQLIRQDRGARLRCRPEADRLRPKRDQPIVVIGRFVGQGDVQRHGMLGTAWGLSVFALQHETWQPGGVN